MRAFAAERDTPRAAHAARADRGQGPDRRLPLARRARRGRRRARSSRGSPRRPRPPASRRHWGRKVLEVRPPVPIDKGQAVRDLVDRAPASRAALFGGDDATDLDAFDALDALARRAAARRRASAWACAPTRARPRSSSAPTWSWTGCDGLRPGAAPALAGRLMRFRDFLRVAVLLFGGGGDGAGGRRRSAGAAREDDNTLVLRRGDLVVRWRRVVGLWLGRRLAPTPRHRPAARRRRASTNALPELEPGTVLFNRLWPLVVLTIARRRDRLPRSRRCRRSPPATRCSWRSPGASSARRWRRSRGATACEFCFDRTSPFGAPQLLRMPGLRKIEPAVDEAVAVSACAACAARPTERVLRLRRRQPGAARGGDAVADVRRAVDAVGVGVDHAASRPPRRPRARRRRSGRGGSGWR